MTAATPHQALYRRWRAQTFSEVVGQDAIIATLRNAVAPARLARDPLRRPRGSARRRSQVPRKAVNCTAPGERRSVRPLPGVRRIREGRALDIIEIDAASNRGINEIRELRERLNTPRPPEAQGLHPRRGAPDHERRLERAPQVARGAARVRHLHVRLHPPPRLPAGNPVPAPALRRPPTDRPRDHRQARPDPRPTGARPTPRLSPSSRGWRPAACATPSRSSTSSSRSTGGRIEADAVRDLLGLADADLVDGFVTALPTGDATAGHRPPRPRSRSEAATSGSSSTRSSTPSVSGCWPRWPPAGAEGTRRSRSPPPGDSPSIDPTRLGPGGIRLQLELALLEPSPGVAAAPVIDAAREPPRLRDRAPSRRPPRCP